jgi:hypothetical protein
MTELYEINRIRIKINNLFTALKEKAPDDFIKALEDAEKEIYEEFNKTTQIINLDEATMQHTEHYRAGIMISSDPKMYWHLHNSITYMLGLQSIRELFTRIYGRGNTPEERKRDGRKKLENYEAEHMSKLIYIEKIAQLQDKIDDMTQQQFNKELEKNNNILTELNKTLTKIEPLNKNLFSIYHIIHQYTSMGQRTVSSQAIQTMLKTQKKIITTDQTQQRGTQ